MSSTSSKILIDGIRNFLTASNLLIIFKLTSHLVMHTRTFAGLQCARSWETRLTLCIQTQSHFRSKTFILLCCNFRCIGGRFQVFFVILSGHENATLFVCDLHHLVGDSFTHAWHNIWECVVLFGLVDTFYCGIWAIGWFARVTIYVCYSMGMS